MTARALLLLGAAAIALPVALSTMTLQTPPAGTTPSKPTELTNSVFSFEDSNGHPEWACLRDGRKDTTPFNFNHARHNDPESPGMKEALLAIKEGKSQAMVAGNDTGRAVHVDENDKGQLWMSCTFCHEMDKGGRYMLPIEHSKHCADCHTTQVGIVYTQGDSLKFENTTLANALALGYSRASALPHRSVREVAGVVDRTISQWVADEAPQFSKAGAEATPAKPADDDGGSRRRRSGDAAPADAKPATPAPDQPATDDGGGRRRNRGAAGENAAPPMVPTRLPPFADQGALTKWMHDQRSQVLGEKIQASCAYCHQRIEPGPPLTPETFQISAQKIPTRWLPNSTFSHLSHAPIMCVSCHTQTTASKKTTDIMLPGIASCRECHSTQGGAPHECVLCHTFHERLPASAQGRQSIEAVHRGGSAVAPARALPAPATAPAEGAPAAKDPK